MIDRNKIRQGLEVFTEDNQPLGTIERLQGDEFYVKGRRYPLNALTRLEQNRLFIGGDNYKNYAQSGTENAKIEIVEERLNVEKRGTQVGEVKINKTVTSEQQQIPVELRHEEVNVQERRVAERPLQEGETAFKEGVIRMPLYGEEAVVSKEAIVTGEVEVNKQQRVERQQVVDNVRKEHVEVDRSGARGESATQKYDVNPNGTSYRQDSYSNGETVLREGLEVLSSDGERIGKVKDFGDGKFILSRGMFKGDLEVDQRSIINANDDKVVVNFTKDYLDNLADV